ncbi:hypothetical protein AAG906_019457 [Vitis piasezkii]
MAPRLWRKTKARKASTTSVHVENEGIVFPQDLKIGSGRGMRELKIFLILNKQRSFPTATVRLYHLCGLVIEQSGC